MKAEIGYGGAAQADTHFAVGLDLEKWATALGCSVVKLSEALMQPGVVFQTFGQGPTAERKPLVITPDANTNVFVVNVEIGRTNWGGIH